MCLKQFAMCNRAWEQVEPNIVENCFRKAGFHHSDLEAPTKLTVNHETAVLYEDFVQMDDDLAICGGTNRCWHFGRCLEHADCHTVLRMMKRKEEEQLEKPIPEIAQAMDHIQEFMYFVGQQNWNEIIF
ncbi:hypothetical protein PR048_002655 [Dryococelus australis]|uniref:Uncharacterized protein n=1 Tax=Dryococelus australis TaxID=614101 RepID=A0ABQ9IM97_9NEOP|nr:hypothetical protein PR048_002655 [Dryococelus australis]